MFRIRRIHDDVLPVNQRALADVQELLRSQFIGAPPRSIDELLLDLRDPLSHKLRSVVLVAENQKGLLGCAVLMYAPDLAFCYLDFIAAAPLGTGAGIGGALYERVREECRMLAARGLFFECLPDDPQDVASPNSLDQNRARLRFYERYGARPLVGNAYQAKVRPDDTDMPLLVFDDLGSGRPLRRSEGRAIVRAILERKYSWLCSPEYIAQVVNSFTTDPVQLRPPRYSRAVPRKTAVSPRVPDDARVLLVVNDRHDIHHVRERGYVEAPARIAAIRAELDKLDIFKTVEPKPFGDQHITAVHDQDFVGYLERVCAALPKGKSIYPYVFPIRNVARPPKDLPVRAGYYCIDTFTPLNQNAWKAARRAVDCTLTAAQAVKRGTRLAYALVRPPGHHAERRVFGGFCYLNNAAIAAHYLSTDGRVAMLDVDYHHGNGQQTMFWERADILTVSIHGHPRHAYPYFSGFADEIGNGPGRGANLNLPQPERLDGNEHAQVLRRAIAAVTSFRPSFLVVCLGFDTAKADPTGSWSLRSSDFERMGSMIGAMRLPTLIVQEGGYNRRSLGQNARMFFQGLWTHASDGRTPAPGKT